MSDIEEQVGATLAAAAEDAPDATGLAAGARRRHRVRRQRRIAVGGVAAALVVAASAVALGTRGDGRPDIAGDPTETPSSTWQTLSEGNARASIPPDWQAYDCPAHEPSKPLYAAPGEDPCADGTGTVLYDGATFDPSLSPGVVTRLEVGESVHWQGYVSAGQYVWSVVSRDRDLTRQILATARVDGQPLVDASQWVSFERDGIAYEVPAWWGVGEDGDRGGYAVCAQPSGANADGVSTGGEPSPRLFRLTEETDGRMIGVTAPTEALAQLVLSGVAAAPDSSDDQSCTEEDFNLGLLPPEGSGEPPVEGNEEALDQITFGDIVLEVPSSWSVKDECGDFVEYSPGGAKCTDLGEGVRFLTPVPDYAYGEGVVVQEDVDGLALWTGYVERGDYAVVVRHPDRAIVEQLLSKVRS